MHSASSLALPNFIPLSSCLLFCLPTAAVKLVCTLYDSNVSDLFLTSVFVSVSILAVLRLFQALINLWGLFLPYSFCEVFNQSLLFFSFTCNLVSFPSPPSLPTPEFLDFQYYSVINFTLPCLSTLLLQVFFFPHLSHNFFPHISTYLV